MPRLILLNGAPGVGKSTLARRWAEDHPPTLNLDIDQVRDLIGGWRADPAQGGLLAREIALTAARTHLLAGHDVIVPQFLGRLPFIEQLDRLTAEVRAEFHEIVLLDSRENTLRRFTERSAGSTDPAHVDARELLNRSGGLPELAAMYDRLLAVLAARPAVRVVPSGAGGVDEAYRDLLAALPDPPAGY